MKLNALDLIASLFNLKPKPVTKKVAAKKRAPRKRRSRANA